MIVNLKKFLQDIYFVSKLTGTKNKKKRIFLSILFLFLAFGSDIVIIIVIASLFQNANFTDIFVYNFLSKIFIYCRSLLYLGKSLVI